jgi:hypothetical protein
MNGSLSDERVAFFPYASHFSYIDLQSPKPFFKSPRLLFIQTINPHDGPVGFIRSFKNGFGCGIYREIKIRWRRVFA